MKYKVKKLLLHAIEEEGFDQAFKETAKEIMKNYKNRSLTADQKEKIKTWGELL